MRAIESKTILSKVKNDPWFRLSYSMNLYRGCSHACIYCDSRSECYQVEEFDKPAFKRNAIELLNKELSTKRNKGIIGFGSMNDPYMPEEKEQNMTRYALELIWKHRFPIHIITKSDLVLRDLDILKKIASIYACISISITTMDENLARKIEPLAPSPSQRLETIRVLRLNGIHAGITLMPILPFINDNVDNVKNIVSSAVEANCEYIIPYFGVTLRKGSREYFYRKLDKYFPGLKEQYVNHFGERYECSSPNSKQLFSEFASLCSFHGLMNSIPEWKFDQQLSINWQGDI